MNAENIALCALLREPVGERKPLAYSEIAKLVRKSDGIRPTKPGVWKALQSMNESKVRRGRKNFLLFRFPSFPPPRSRPIRENPLSCSMFLRQFPYLVPLLGMIWNRGRRRVFRQLN